MTRGSNTIARFIILSRARIKKPLRRHLASVWLLLLECTRHCFDTVTPTRAALFQRAQSICLWPPVLETIAPISSGTRLVLLSSASRIQLDCVTLLVPFGVATYERKTNWTRSKHIDEALVWPNHGQQRPEIKRRFKTCGTHLMSYGSRYCLLANLSSLHWRRRCSAVAVVAVAGPPFR